MLREGLFDGLRITLREEGEVVDSCHVCNWRILICGHEVYLDYPSKDDTDMLIDPETIIRGMLGGKEVLLWEEDSAYGTRSYAAEGKQAISMLVYKIITEFNLGIMVDSSLPLGYWKRSPELVPEEFTELITWIVLLEYCLERSSNCNLEFGRWIMKQDLVYGYEYSLGLRESACTLYAFLFQTK